MFEVQTYKKRFDANKVNILEKGRYPYVVRTSLNNGVKGYIEEDTAFLNDGNTISFGQDTATSFYQKVPYFTGDKIKILKSRLEGFDADNALFFVTAITRSFEKFSWGSSSYSVNIIKNQRIKLPIFDGKIDLDWIKLYSKAIYKLIIKDVVQYADRKIEATKKVVKIHNR